MSRNVEYILTLSGNYEKRLKNATDQTDKFQKKTGLVGKAVKRILPLLAGIATASTAKKILDLGANMEQTQVAFATFLGDAEKANKLISELNEFANVTPFDNESVIQAGRALLAANIPAEKIQDTLRQIGDVAAGANVPLGDMANIYAKAMNKGRLQAEELNQLAERGVPILSTLADMFGKSTQEVMKMGSEGKLTSDVMNKAFEKMTKEGGVFFNLMAKQSETQGGLFSTLTGKLQTLGIELGNRMLPSTKQFTKSAIRAVDVLNDWVKVPLSDQLRQSKIEMNQQFAALKRLSPESQKYKELIQDINTQYKNYLPNLIDEKDSLEDIEKARVAANKALLQSIELQAKRDILQDQINRVVKAQAALIQSEIKAAKTIESIGDEATINRQNNIKELQRQLKEEQDKRDEASEQVIKSLKKQIREEQSVLFATGLGGQNVEERYDSIIARRRKALEQEQLELEKLQKRFSDIDLNLSGGRTGEVDVKTNVQPDKKTEDLLSKITSRAPKVINITIGKLIETQEINTTNLTEGSTQIKRLITQQILEAVNDTQLSFKAG